MLNKHLEKNNVKCVYNLLYDNFAGNKIIYVIHKNKRTYLELWSFNIPTDLYTLFYSLDASKYKIIKLSEY